ncbi:Coenzyme Q-binding protein COQ10, START domain containing protein [Parasponia andersonii]|uniref:Coenzyme Q-binding protein COQ10, START domain containing protein n=1 Tax=Parasponia andersonii TaxID=3476 RepID=A0A2P5B383_PARAD|nr:Coenzyme Q-binding protein COQ10, START domain containing protein [Parasponia andersonii]
MVSRMGCYANLSCIQREQRERERKGKERKGKERKPSSFFYSKPIVLLRPCRPPTPLFRLRCSVSSSDSDSDSDGVFIEIQKLPNNSRRILSSVAIQAPLQTVWNVGQQNLGFGLKFNARGILDCYEKQLQILPSGQRRRDIEFNMVQGDFQIFQGNWSILQLDRGGDGDGDGDDDSLIDHQEMHTTLSYFVHVKPKLWLPVQLVEDRLCSEIKLNLSCIRQEAQKAVGNTNLFLSE